MSCLPGQSQKGNPTDMGQFISQSYESLCMHFYQILGHQFLGGFQVLLTILSNGLFFNAAQSDCVTYLSLFISK